MKAGLLFPYLPNFFLSLLLASWLTNADWRLAPSVLLFFLFVTLFKNAYRLLLPLFILDFIQRLYRDYAGKGIDVAEIRLFFMHLDEVVESGAMVWGSAVEVFPAVLFVLAVSWGLYRVRFIKEAGLGIRGSLLALLILWLGLQSDGGRLAFGGVSAAYGSITGVGETVRQIGLSAECRAGESERDIILVIGESLLYEARFFKDFLLPVRPVIAGAVNTDTSLPLLLNGKRRVIDLREKSPENLFYLAKRNGYATAFISAQSEGNLKYIRPYLYPEAVDYLKTYERDDLGGLYDEVLVKELAKLERSKKSFVVLQMLGEHSPYTFYPESFASRSSLPEREKRVGEDYDNSVHFTISRLEKIIALAKRESERPVSVIFTSDHGEMTKKPFGHNRFEPEVYTVPFFIYPSEGDLGESVVTHRDIYRMIRRALGWECHGEKTAGPILVGGTMLSGEDGYFEITEKKDGIPMGERRWF